MIPVAKEKKKVLEAVAEDRPSAFEQFKEHGKKKAGTLRDRFKSQDAREELEDELDTMFGFEDEDDETRSGLGTSPLGDALTDD